MEPNNSCLMAGSLQIQDLGDGYTFRFVPLFQPDSGLLADALFQCGKALIQSWYQIFFHILFQNEPCMIGEIDLGCVLGIGSKKNNLAAGAPDMNGFCQIDTITPAKADV